jgi:hypothetical protein
MAVATCFETRQKDPTDQTVRFALLGATRIGSASQSSTINRGHATRYDDQHAAFRLLKSNDFIQDSATGSWSSREQRKHITYEAFADKSYEWLSDIVAEVVPNGQFWFYSQHERNAAAFAELVSKLDLQGLRPIAKPYAAKRENIWLTRFVRFQRSHSPNVDMREQK